MMAGRLIIICGLPGAGKTTRAKALEGSLRAVRLCADEWMDALGINLWDQAARSKVEALQWTLGQRLIELGQTIVIEWGMWARSERDALRNAARTLGASVELHYLPAPVEELIKRLKARGMEDPPITRDQLEMWVNTFEAPIADEAALYDRYWSKDSVAETSE
jgi:predicted kinase